MYLSLKLLIMALPSPVRIGEHKRAKHGAPGLCAGAGEGDEGAGGVRGRNTIDEKGDG
jgi:hypothetical protein